MKKKLKWKKSWKRNMSSSLTKPSGQDQNQKLIAKQRNMLNLGKLIGQARASNFQGLQRIPVGIIFDAKNDGLKFRKVDCLCQEISNA